MVVIWDPRKAKQNLRKHAISFEEAETILTSQRQLILPDPDHAEDRFIALGHSDRARMLTVVYCYRCEDVIRIISARRATKRERIIYEERV